MLYRAKVQGKVLMIYNPIGMTLYPINFILYSYVISWYSNIEDEDGPCISRYLSPQGIHHICYHIKFDELGSYLI